ncbi:hypothetical protein MMC10_009526 [Thelotrema lepadinum]|nr:hypothetical protein [Thelotrema lepadinum]
MTADEEIDKVVAILSPISEAAISMEDTAAQATSSPQDSMLDQSQSSSDELYWEFTFEHLAQMRNGRFGWTCGIRTFESCQIPAYCTSLAAFPSPENQMDFRPLCRFYLNLDAGRLVIESLADSVKYCENGRWQEIEESNLFIMERSRYQLQLADDLIYEISYHRLSNGPTVLAKNIWWYLGYLSFNDAEALRKLTSGLPPDMVKKNGIVMINPESGGANRRVVPGYIAEKGGEVQLGREVQLRVIKVTNKQEREDALALKALYDNWGKKSRMGNNRTEEDRGIHHVEGGKFIVKKVFCDHLSSEESGPCLDIVKDNYYIVHQPTIGTFADFDWTLVDGEAFMAFCFTSLVGMYILHQEECVHGQENAVNEIVIKSISPEPEAALTGYRKTKLTGRQPISEEKIQDLKNWSRAVCQVIALKYGYDWDAMLQMNDGLKEHAIQVPADQALTDLLIFLNSYNKPFTKLHNCTARHALRHECWVGLGRWTYMKVEHDSSFDRSGSSGSI